jgi:hypothetical protein
MLLSHNILRLPNVRFIFRLAPKFANISTLQHPSHNNTATNTVETEQGASRAARHKDIAVLPANKSYDSTLLTSKECNSFERPELQSVAKQGLPRARICAESGPPPASKHFCMRVCKLANTSGNVTSVMAATSRRNGSLRASKVPGYLLYTRPFSKPHKVWWSWRPQTFRN